MINPESLSLIGGVVIKLGTDYLKRASWFTPVSDGQSARIHALVGVLSAVLAVVSVWGTDGFNESVVEGLIQSLIMAAQSWGVSIGVNEVSKLGSKST